MARKDRDKIDLTRILIFLYNERSNRVDKKPAIAAVAYRTTMDVVRIPRT